MVIVIVANGLEPQRERHEQGLTHQRTAPVSASVKSSSIRLKVALTALPVRFVSIGVFDSGEVTALSPDEVFNSRVTIIFGPHRQTFATQSNNSLDTYLGSLWAPFTVSGPLAPPVLPGGADG